MGTAQRKREYFKEGPGTGNWPREGGGRELDLSEKRETGKLKKIDPETEQ